MEIYRLLADFLQFKNISNKPINVCFVQVVSTVVLLLQIHYKMAESFNSTMISLDEAVGLAQDEDGILGTDSESEFSENDDDSSLVNHNSDWVSI